MIYFSNFNNKHTKHYNPYITICTSIISKQNSNQSTEDRTGKNDIKMNKYYDKTNETSNYNDKSPNGNHDQTGKFCSLKIALWNANELSHQVFEVETFKINKINILLVFETHFTNKNYFKIHNYEFYQTMHLDVTAHERSAVLVRNNIKHHEGENS